MKRWIKVSLGFALAFAGAGVGAFASAPWCGFAVPLLLAALLLVDSVMFGR